MITGTRKVRPSSIGVFHLGLYKYSKRTLLRIVFYPYFHSRAIRSRILPCSANARFHFYNHCDMSSKGKRRYCGTKCILPAGVHTVRMFARMVDKICRLSSPPSDLSYSVIQNMAGYVPGLTCSSSPAVVVPHSAHFRMVCVEP
jgi:hypothetical protein